MAATTHDPQSGGQAVDPSFDLPAACATTTFFTHTMPDIPANSEIIGICTVSGNDASPDKFGWLVSDFLAFKQLLHKEGSKEAQVWFSLVDPAQAMKDYSTTYAHGEEADAFVRGTSTFAKEDLKGKNVSKVASTMITIIPELERMRVRLLRDIEARAKSALERHTGLVIFAAAFSTVNQDICLDITSGQYLTRTEIQEAAGAEIPIVLITPAPLCGGWQVNMQVGKYDNVPISVQKAVVAKHCGGVFADQLKRVFSAGKTCPFLTPDEQNSAPDDLTPNQPALRLEQKSYLNAIQTLLTTRMNEFPHVHSLNLNPDDDDWAVNWKSRTGAPLDYWAKKWDEIPFAPSDARPDFFRFLGHVFGSSKASQQAYIRALVIQELETCPGDALKPENSKTYSVFNAFLRQRIPDEEQCREVFRLVEYRSSGMALADTIVALLKLPRPQGRTCRFWNKTVSDELTTRPSRYTAAFHKAWAMILDVWPLMPLSPGRHRDPLTDIKFWRPSFYLAAAVAAKFMDEGMLDRTELVQRFVKQKVYGAFKFMYGIQRQILVENKFLGPIAMKFLKTIGVKMESPAEAPAVKVDHSLDASRHNEVLQNKEDPSGAAAKAADPWQGVVPAEAANEPKQVSPEATGRGLTREEIRTAPAHSNVSQGAGSVPEQMAQPAVGQKLSAAAARKKIEEEMVKKFFKQVGPRKLAAPPTPPGLKVPKVAYPGVKPPSTPPLEQSKSPVPTINVQPATPHGLVVGRGMPENTRVTDVTIPKNKQPATEHEARGATHQEQEGSASKEGIVGMMVDKILQNNATLNDVPQDERDAVMREMITRLRGISLGAPGSSKVNTDAPLVESGISREGKSTAANLPEKSVPHAKENIPITQPPSEAKPEQTNPFGYRKHREDDW